MKSLVLYAAAIAALTTALPAAAQFAKPEDAIKYRQSGMSLMATHFGRLGAMASGKGALRGESRRRERRGRRLRLAKPAMERMTAGGPGMIFLQLRGFTAIEGGLPIIVDGKQIGSIGVSGGSSAQDDQIGKAGLAALKS